MDGLTVYALDKGFDLVTNEIPYDNLQWNRRYYEAGFFEMQIPISVYDSSWKYIGSNDRPELGMVQKVYSTEFDMVILSGFFCEKMLDWKAIYPAFDSMMIPEGNAMYSTKYIDEIARRMFILYKEDLPIKLAPSDNLEIVNETTVETVDGHLGETIYSIIEPFGLSCKVWLDPLTNGLCFGVWRGLDRTQSQSENSFQTFSLEFGNILSRSIDFDDSDYYNFAIAPYFADDEGKEQGVMYLDWSRGEMKRKIVFDLRSSRPDEGKGINDQDFHKSLIQEMSQRLMAYAKVESIDVDVTEIGYMTDYDLGDKCDVFLTDIALMMETRIVEVNEVFKADGGHTISVGLGNKRLGNLRRAVNSI